MPLSRVPTAQLTGALSFCNRIINGDMRIDQRNAGASVSASAGNYQLDRFSTALSGGGAFTVQRSTTAPSGFANSVQLTVTTPDTSLAAGDYYGYQQYIEGFNAADFGFGTASAQSITISFWVRSSVVGTYCVWLNNGPNSRSYVATYTINLANTWEQKTITIAGDTSGTWPSDNTAWGRVWFTLGGGSSFNAAANSWQSGTYFQTSTQTQWISTSGATFYITGVQLEAGSVATSFERRDYGRELMMCQRYYETATVVVVPTVSGIAQNCGWKAEKRATPTLQFTPNFGSGASFNAQLTGGCFQSTNHSTWTSGTLTASAEL